MLARSITELAALVKNQRKRLGLTQRDVAERVGLKQKTISGFENYPDCIRLETLFQILSAVNLEIQLSPKGEKEEQHWTEAW